MQEQEKIVRALDIIRHEQANPSSILRQKLTKAIDIVVEATAETYTRESEQYVKARASQPWAEDARMTDLLLGLVRSRIDRGELQLTDSKRWKLLDVGAGYGRDVIRFSQEPDIDPIALENAPGFVPALRRLQHSGELGPNALIIEDMRAMAQIVDSSIQCVRNHATLHHLPVVGQGLGADAAVAECRRVLLPGGVMYVLVKAGEGISFIDTKEGLGGRFFQLFTPSMLTELLGRHGFSVVRLEELVESRGATDVPWIFALAVTC